MTGIKKNESLNPQGIHKYRLLAYFFLISKRMEKPIFKKSTRKDKKYMTTYNGKTVHFGQIGYEHYKD
jgi:hypothetical protein